MEAPSHREGLQTHQKTATFVNVREIPPHGKPSSSHGSMGAVVQETCGYFSLPKLEDIIFHQEAITQFEEKAMLWAAL